jgi:hypothetical protein
MKTIRNLIITFVVLILLTSCDTPKENDQQSQPILQTEFQSVRDKLGVLNSLDKENNTFTFVMLPEKQGDAAKSLKLQYNNPIVESQIITNASVDSLQNGQSVRLSAVSNGTNYDATKIVILSSPKNTELKTNLDFKSSPQKPKKP